MLFIVWRNLSQYFLVSYQNTTFTVFHDNHKDKTSLVCTYLGAVHTHDTQYEGNVSMSQLYLQRKRRRQLLPEPQRKSNFILSLF